MNEEYISPEGHTWDEVRAEVYSPEEIAASDARVAKIMKKIAARDRRRAALRYIVTGIALLLPKPKQLNNPLNTRS